MTTDQPDQVTEPGFSLDDFQQQAVDAVERGCSVLVAAPTGAGKTVIAEAAVRDALRSSGRVFYTTPIKALSNQKFNDLAVMFGEERVGLLTGDNTIRPDAEIVVMTTEVLRNRIYSDRSDRALTGLRWVILDEVHYLGDPYRGAVWEEVVLGTPSTARFVYLSATVSNAVEFGEWLRQERGDVEVVVSHTRPVPLRHSHVVTDKAAPTPLSVFDASDRGRFAKIESTRFLDDGYDDYDDFDDYGYRGYREWRYSTPQADDVVRHLKTLNRLPVIYFVFSRDGCDNKADSLATRNLNLTTPEEQGLITEFAERRLAALQPSERGDLGADSWAKRLRSGVAAHHAGLAPIFKEIVEECFIAGFIKVIFATETLALGMNMPARTTVIDKLTKFNGTDHAALTAGEYTQMAGRAGRRGIDTDGLCMTLWSPYVNGHEVTSVVNAKSFHLRSQFMPNYNMVANLARRYTLKEATDLMRRSFGAYQTAAAQQAKVRSARTKLDELVAQRNRVGIEAASPLGDINEYIQLRKQANKAARAKAKAAAVSVVIRQGDVYAVDDGWVTVLSAHNPEIGDDTRVRVWTEHGHERKYRLNNLVETFFGGKPLGRIDLPKGNVRDDAWHTKAVQAVQEVLAAHTEPAIEPDTEPLYLTHRVHTDPQRDVRCAAHKKLSNLDRNITKTRKQLDSLKAPEGVRIDRITSVLSDLGYLECSKQSWTLTAKGEILAGIHREQDLLVAETLESGCLNGLNPPELAAAASTLVYEHRSRETPNPAAYPTPQTKEAVHQIAAIRKRLRALEKRRQLRLTPGDPNSEATGFFNHAYAWTAGAGLKAATGDAGSAGDFIRNIRIVADVLQQIANAATNRDLRSTARNAIKTIRRGVVVADTISAVSVSPTTTPSVAAEPGDGLRVVLNAIKGPAPKRLTPETYKPRLTPPPFKDLFTTTTRPKTHFSAASLKHRGWTDAMIRDHLGDPDKQGVNPHYRSGPQTRLYSIERVERIETTEAFQQRLTQANTRRQARGIPPITPPST